MTRITQLLQYGAAAMLLGAAAFGTAAKATTYSLTDLGTLGGTLGES